MGENLSRREFFKKAGIIGVTTAGIGLGGGQLLNLFEEEADAAGSVICVASGSKPDSMTKKAIDGLGGIQRFVKRGNTVCIKANLGWARRPDQAATTNPVVLSTVIKLCKQAGASRVTVVEYTCDPSTPSLEMSEGKAVCSSLGARLVSGDNPSVYRRISIPRGKSLKSDQCMKDVLDSDVFINIPIAKVHGGAVITASMKNLMGISFNRGNWHQKDLHQCIADYSTVVRPHLVILDAVRVLLTNGPKGPGETKDVHQVIAGTDPVAIDAYAAKLLGKKPDEVRHIVFAEALGVGHINASIKRV
jgi:uncharacterized protein (DUF362 family)